MPGIDPVVDLYQAVSLRYTIPVGGENRAADVATPGLTVADGNELFDTVKEGQPPHESPEPGEVVWQDDIGVTCRRWNWRQGTRTRLSVESQQMWFILESLPEMPLTTLQEAGEMLIKGLQDMMPETEVQQKLIGFFLATSPQPRL